MIAIGITNVVGTWEPFVATLELDPATKDEDESLEAFVMGMMFDEYQLEFSKYLLIENDKHILQWNCSFDTESEE